MKRQKWMLFLLVLSLASVLLSACGGNAESRNNAGQASAAPTVKDEDDAAFRTAAADSEAGGGPVYVFTYKDTAIVPGAGMDDVLEAIGMPLNVFEAPSCAFDGVDRIFYYPGFIINTYPKNGRDTILSVSFRDDSVTTYEGIYLGMNVAGVEAAYGAGEWNDMGNLLSYDSGGVRLAFIFESGTIIDITYYVIEP